MDVKPIILDVDFKRNTIMKEHKVRHGDNIPLMLRVFDDGEAFDLSNMKTISLVITRLDRQTIVLLGSVHENQATFNLGGKELAVSGSVQATAQFYSVDGRVSTFNFKIIAESDPITNYIPLKEEETLIIQVLKNGPVVIEAAQTATIGAIQAEGVALLAAEEANKSRDNLTEGIGRALNSLEEDKAKAILEMQDEKRLTQQVKADTLAVKEEVLEVAETIKTQGDYAKEQGEFAKVEMERAKAEADRLEGTDVSILDNKITNINNNLTTQLADSAKKVEENKRANNYFWMPEKQPPAITEEGSEPRFINAWAGGSEEWINTHFEPIRAANPNYITRSSLGKDQSGTYDVWKYVLEPERYTKTIILVGGLHGNEATPVFTLIRLLHYLTKEYEKYPQIAYLRENVRIIMVPICNPWGFSQTPNRTRWNSRGIDINRNFAKYWDVYDPNKAVLPFTFGSKGTTPMSEVETQYMDKLVKEYPTAVAVIDMHNTGAPTNYDFFYVLPVNYKYNTMDKVLDYFAKDITNPVIQIDNGQIPNFYNHVYDLYKIPVMAIEWCDGRRGRQYGSVEVTAALAWYTNTIIEHCRDYKKEPFFIEAYYNHTTTPINLSLTNYAELEQFQIRTKIPCPGILKVTYTITILGQNAETVNYIAPVIEQSGTDVYPISTGNTEIYAQGTTRASLTASTSRFVYPSEDGKGEAIAKLMAKTTVGTNNYVARLRAIVEFVPSDIRSRQQILSATNRVGEGVNAFQEVWKG